MKRVKAFRELVVAEARRHNMPCHICGQPIDYTLPHGHRKAVEMDHLVPQANDGPLHEFDNVDVAHAFCNRIKGKGSVGMMGEPS